MAWRHATKIDHHLLIVSRLFTSAANIIGAVAVAIVVVVAIRVLNGDRCAVVFVVVDALYILVRVRSRCAAAPVAF